jgi:hypothetical protein
VQELLPPGITLIFIGNRLEDAESPEALTNDIVAPSLGLFKIVHSHKRLTQLDRDRAETPVLQLGRD